MYKWCTYIEVSSFSHNSPNSPTHRRSIRPISVDSLCLTQTGRVTPCAARTANVLMVQVNRIYYPPNRLSTNPRVDSLLIFRYYKSLQSRTFLRELLSSRKTKIWFMKNASFPHGIRTLNIAAEELLLYLYWESGLVAFGVLPVFNSSL